jgi:hypothetical protein
MTVSSVKTVATDVGSIRLGIPRDRLGSIKPQIVCGVYTAPPPTSRRLRFNGIEADWGPRVLGHHQAMAQHLGHVHPVPCLPGRISILVEGHEGVRLVGWVAVRLVGAECVLRSCVGTSAGGQDAASRRYAMLASRRRSTIPWRVSPRVAEVYQGGSRLHFGHGGVRSPRYSSHRVGFVSFTVATRVASTKRSRR